MKLKNIFMLIKLGILILFFSSCSVAKYNYYYSTINTDNANVEKYNSDNWAGRLSRFTTNVISNNRNDSITFSTRIAKEGLDIRFHNNNPIYINFDKTIVDINNIICKIDSGSIELYGIKAYDSRFPLYHFGYFVYFPIKLDNLYQKYNDDNYKNDSNFIDKRKTHYSSIDFTKENTPLLIKLHVVYYTDKNYQNEQVINLEFYQSSLAKIKDQRYHKGWKNMVYQNGEEIGKNMGGITFYTKYQSGTVYGWPEIRRGLG